MSRYRFIIGMTLIVLVLSESIYFLWRENYLKPEIEKRTQTLESKIASIENVTANGNSLQQVDAGQLITQSQSASSATEETKTAETKSVPVSVTKTVEKIGKININTASAVELDKLPGIGTTIAQSIISYRQDHGGFKSIEEIKNVNRIGDATFNKMKDQISI